MVENCADQNLEEDIPFSGIDVGSFRLVCYDSEFIPLFRGPFAGE